MKTRLAKLTAIQQFKKNIGVKYGIVRPENRTLCEDNNFRNENEDVVGNIPNTLKKVQGSSHPPFPSLEPLLKASFTSSAVVGFTKQEVTSEEEPRWQHR